MIAARCCPVVVLSLHENWKRPSAAALQQHAADRLLRIPLPGLRAPVPAPGSGLLLSFTPARVKSDAADPSAVSRTGEPDRRRRGGRTSGLSGEGTGGEQPRRRC